MDTLNHFILQVITTLQTSTEFSEKVAAQDTCEFICIFNDLKALMMVKTYPPVLNESFLQIFSSISTESFSFWEVLNLILIQVHDHTTKHLKLSEDFCPYHQVFSLKYLSEYKCDCVDQLERLDVESLDYPVECSKLVKIQKEKVYKNIEWKKYLKNFEDKAVNIYELAKECRNSVCRMIPQYKLTLKHLSENFMFSVILKDYPNPKEILRLFSMFPLTLVFPGFSPKFQIFAFLLLSKNKTGSLTFEPGKNHWVLLINNEIITGKFSSLIESILNHQLFPVHVFYSSVFKEIPDFRDQAFFALQLNPGLTKKETPETLPFLGSRVFKNYSENFWICSCRIVNFSQTCSFCSRPKPKHSIPWKCFCLKSSFKFQCECKRTIPECSLCQGLFSWKAVNCLRCEGFIVLGKCEVCSYSQFKSICPKCLSEFWKCEICLFPNRNSEICLRCNNPKLSALKAVQDLLWLESFEYLAF